MKRRIFLVGILALSLIAIALAQSNRVTLGVLRDCRTLEWETEEPVYGTCRKRITTDVCSDPPFNRSCRKQTKQIEYKCRTGTNIIPHNKKVCTPKAYEIRKEKAELIEERGRINFKEWGECSYEKEGNDIIITCDSRYDGNNDGLCQSGESCVRFVVTQDKVKRFMKNSQKEFTEEDKSFFLEKLDYEVMSE